MPEAIEPIIEMRSIRKQFLDVVANRDVNLKLFPGEICALLGENGAGKTTLMNILFGYYTCDEGEIFIGGEKAVLTSPRDAISRGIGMVHQHFTLVPSQTVLENVIVGAEAGRGLFIDEKAARRKLISIQERFGLRVNPDAKVWTLSVGEQQRVEILKALYRDARVLIMDEPTAVLSPLETVELFKTLRSLVNEGRSVIFISHKLNEVMEIADRIVVLRGGVVVAERKKEETNTRELANLMVGRDFVKRSPKRSLSSGEPVLEITDLLVLNDKGLAAVKNVSLTVLGGEILGIAGVSGNGQRELAEVLFGMRIPVHGEVRVRGQVLPPGNPLLAINLGMARIPEDRMETGLLLDLSVEENLMLENHRSDEFHRMGIVNHGKIADFSEELIERYGIKAAGKDVAAKTLSGGNLQKVILARELVGNPRVVVAAQPTRGLDVGATEYVHQQLEKAKEAGAGVLLISENLDEIFELSDRIAVMYNGEIVGVVPADEAVRDQVGLWMSGVKKP